MSKAKIAVLVSGGGTNLQALIDAQNAGLIPNGEIALVVSNRKAAYALERAKNHGIEGVVLSKYMQPDPEKYDEMLLEILKERGMTSKQLCEVVGITEANMSVLRSGKAKGVRFHTLNRICYYLDCSVGDILFFDGELDEEDSNEEG